MSPVRFLERKPDTIPWERTMIKRAIKLDIKQEGKEKTREATKKREKERQILTRHFQWLLRPEILTLWPSIWEASPPERNNIKIYETSRTRSRVNNRCKWLDGELQRNISTTDNWSNRNGHHDQFKEYGSLCRLNVSHKLDWESRRYFPTSLLVFPRNDVCSTRAYGISALVPQSSFRGKIIGGVAKWRLFSHAAADQWGA